MTENQKLYDETLPASLFVDALGEGAILILDEVDTSLTPEQENVMKHRVLPAHYNQDGFVYIRVKRTGAVLRSRTGETVTFYEQPWNIERGIKVDDVYLDSSKDARTISSRRVEHGVEIADYLAKCDVQGWAAEYEKGRWVVCTWEGVCQAGATLREAYHRLDNLLKAEAEAITKSAIAQTVADEMDIADATFAHSVR